MDKFLLHILPDSVENSKKFYVGTTKDLRGRTEFFTKRNIPFREFISKDRSDEYVLNGLKNMDLSQCFAVLFEGEGYIESLRYLKEAHPAITRIMRSYNANLPHFFDNFRGHIRMKQSKKAVGDARHALIRYQKDRLCAELSDYVLAITDWEKKHYWDAITNPEKIISAAYYVPTIYTEKIPTLKRTDICVCFMGTAGVMTPLLYDAGANTVALIRALKERLSSWEFILTGRLDPPDMFGKLGRVKHVGRLQEPMELLAISRVVTILSDFGFGFKTKILEALVAGCWVFVTQDLYNRLPEIIRPGCKIVDVRSMKSFKTALLECIIPPPELDYNTMLRTQAYAAMDSLFPSYAANSDAAPSYEAELPVPATVM